MVEQLTTIYILWHLEDAGVQTFTTQEFARLFHLEADRAHQVLYRLEKRGIVRRFKRGRYVVLGLGGREALGHAFFLGTRLVEPSYVGFWSALHYYGWTEQAPRVVSVANTKRSREARVEAYSIRLVKLRADRFFGYTVGVQGTYGFPIAEPEKAILDSLLLPSRSGGVEEAAKALVEAAGELRLERLESYAIQLRSETVVSRIGHLLAGVGIESKTLRPFAAKFYVRLDPSLPRRGRYDSAWHVINNLPGGV